MVKYPSAWQSPHQASQTGVTKLIWILLSACVLITMVKPAQAAGQISVVVTDPYGADCTTQHLVGSGPANISLGCNVNAAAIADANYQYANYPPYTFGATSASCTPFASFNNWQFSCYVSGSAGYLQLNLSWYPGFPARTCPINSTPDNIGNPTSCICTNPFIPDATATSCVCPAGTQLDAAGTACVAVPSCPVLELRDIVTIPPNGADVLPLTQRLEATLGADLALLPGASAGLACLTAKASAIGVAIGNPSSGTRTVAYQAHLFEIWDKLRQIDVLKVNDPTQYQACLPRRAIIEKARSDHAIQSRPAETGGQHPLGNAFDINTTVIDSILAKVSPLIPPIARNPTWNNKQYQAQQDAQQIRVNIQKMAAWLASPTPTVACGLIWGGSFSTQYDKWHFNTP